MTRQEFEEYYNTLDYDTKEVVLEILMDELEMISEDVVCKDIGGSIYIAVTADQGRNFELDPYFKVSWKPINTTNKDVARISMTTGDYIIHYNSSVEIPAKVVDKINSMLKEQKYLAAKYKPLAENGWEGLLVAIALQTNNYDKLEIMKKQFPKIIINPDNAALNKNCSTVKKWGK